MSPLSRLPELGIPVLDSQWIQASLQRGELLKIRPFQLETFGIARDTSHSEERSGQPDSTSPGQSRPQAVPESYEASALLPPSPESLQVQDTILSDANIGARSSDLPPKTHADTRQTQMRPLPTLQGRKNFVCHGACPELTCQHRPELRLGDTVIKKSRPLFRDLTGYSPAPKKRHLGEPGYQLKKVVGDTEPLPSSTAAPGEIHENRLPHRLAKIKSDIDTKKRPGLDKAQIKVESPLRTTAVFHKRGAPLHSTSPYVKREASSPYGVRHPLDTPSIKPKTVEHYRKRYLAPMVLLTETEENGDLDVTEEGQMISSMPQDVTENGRRPSPPLEQITPLSLK